MQVLATKTGSELKLTKREKALLEDCKEFVELLGKHGDKSMAGERRQGSTGDRQPAIRN